MTQRNFIPGDKWLYYKVYCGIKTANMLLLNAIQPTVKELMINKMVESWFFVRYFDPEPHLRIRLKIRSQNDIGFIIQKFFYEFNERIEEGTIWRVVLDSYIRELERYGNATIATAEKIFHADSELVVKLIRMGNSQEIFLWGILKSVDHFLDLFQFNLKQKNELYNLGANYYNNEFGVQNKWISKVRKIYSNKKLASLYSNNLELNDDYNSILSVINERDEAIKEVIKRLVQVQENGNLEVSAINFIQSCIHMFYNRAYENYQRRAEQIGYNLMSSYLF